MSFADRCRMAALAFMGIPDSPRWLRQRDEFRDEVDRYRSAAGLIVGEFVGPKHTATKIVERIRSLEAENFRLKSERR